MLHVARSVIWLTVFPLSYKLPHSSTSPLYGLDDMWGPERQGFPCGPHYHLEFVPLSPATWVLNTYIIFLSSHCMILICMISEFYWPLTLCLLSLEASLLDFDPFVSSINLHHLVLCVVKNFDCLIWETKVIKWGHLKLK